MSSENEKDGQSSDTAATSSEDAGSLSKDEAKKLYEDKGIDFSPDSPVRPKPVPQFEKSISDKIASKFGSKVTVDYVRASRIRVSTKKADILDVAFFIRDELGYDHAESVAGVD